MMMVVYLAVLVVKKQGDLFVCVALLVAATSQKISLSTSPSDTNGLGARVRGASFSEVFLGVPGT